MNQLLRVLSVNHEVEGWQNTAMSWLIAALVVATTAGLLMLAIKFIMKQTSGIAKKRVWSRSRTIAFLVIGLPLIAATLAVTWHLSNDFTTVTGLPGLFKGIALAWLSYAIVSLAGHAGPWRREIF